MYREGIPPLSHTAQKYSFPSIIKVAMGTHNLLKLLRGPGTFPSISNRANAPSRIHVPPRMSAELLYLLNGLANIIPITAESPNESTESNHGGYEAIILVLKMRPKDPRLQAAGVKAIRVLALHGGRSSIEVFARLGAPTAITRAQGLFPYNREVQFACLGATEILCRDGDQALNRSVFVSAGGIALLENALNVATFAADSEFVAQGLRALVAIASPVPNQVTRSPDDSGGTLAPSWSSLKGADKAENSRVNSSGGRTSRAIGTVLAAMERNRCREVCFAGFNALDRFLVALKDEKDDAELGRANGEEGNLLLLPTLSAQVAYTVRRALKLNESEGQEDSELGLKGERILRTVAVLGKSRTIAQ